MKKIKFLFGALLLMFAVTSLCSCSDDDEPEVRSLERTTWNYGTIDISDDDEDGRWTMKCTRHLTFLDNKSGILYCEGSEKYDANPDYNNTFKMLHKFDYEFKGDEGTFTFTKTSGSVTFEDGTVEKYTMTINEDVDERTYRIKLSNDGKQLAILGVTEPGTLTFDEALPLMKYEEVKWEEYAPANSEVEMRMALGSFGYNPSVYYVCPVCGKRFYTPTNCPTCDEDPYPVIRNL